MQQFTFAARGRHYTVKTEKFDDPALTMTGFWTYQPSVVLPSPLTGNKFVLLLNRNRVNGIGQTSGELITARVSNDPISFGSETTILDNRDVDNICDMIDARPIWDGSQWHIYVQAVEGNFSVFPCSSSVNNIYEAVGSSLNPPSTFQWVKIPGTNHAKVIIAGSGSAGIGEDLQWFNPSPYGLPGFRFMVTFQDWGCSAFAECNHAIWSYRSQDGITYSFWYGPNPFADPPETAPYLTLAGFSNFRYTWPDAIFLGSLDAARKGNPGIGFSSICYEGPPADHKYQYAKWIGFFNNPSRVPTTSPQSAEAFQGELEGVSSDSHGPRMFRPKVARNEYGYIPPQSRRGYPRTWITYLYYTSTQININAGDNCDGYSRRYSTNSIGVSRLTITERR